MVRSIASRTIASRQIASRRIATQASTSGATTSSFAGVFAPGSSTFTATATGNHLFTFWGGGGGATAGVLCGGGGEIAQARVFLVAGQSVTLSVAANSNIDADGGTTTLTFPGGATATALGGKSGTNGGTGGTGGTGGIARSAGVTGGAVGGTPGMGGTISPYAAPAADAVTSAAQTRFAAGGFASGGSAWGGAGGLALVVRES